jgi:phosphatidylserine/phosphatidylglycerophosphate/cardiolipin synthase-like enzyme
MTGSDPAAWPGSGSRDSAPERWFLTSQERGNPATAIDRGRGDGRAWTEGNAVVPLLHGGTYFARLHAGIERLRPGDHLWLLDWRGDADERLVGEPGSELGRVLSEAARRGVDVRGLVWRSHPDQEKFSEQENLHLGAVVNRAGGEILLDERVRRFGSHHQKLVLLGRPGREEEDVAFAGGIDLCHGRRDDERHDGDPQRIVLDRRYGPRPAWHDAQLEIRGPAVGDLSTTFRERCSSRRRGSRRGAGGPRRWTPGTPVGGGDPGRRVGSAGTGRARCPLPSGGWPCPCTDWRSTRTAGRETCAGPAACERRRTGPVRPGRMQGPARPAWPDGGAGLD